MKRLWQRLGKFRWLAILGLALLIGVGIATAIAGSAQADQRQHRSDANIVLTDNGADQSDNETPKTTETKPAKSKTTNDDTPLKQAPESQGPVTLEPDKLPQTGSSAISWWLGPSLLALAGVLVWQRRKLVTVTS
ncbi:LPXTG cell wall anchor domain-containing protein [Loigolactobacillus binensis]|uniref:LPXTG cell wall anchor domain-containing protein n=1 Tax=Loigolactobacillus binensis TaxID=2559922 RepID=A0ABW3ED58_9LACO|nr:LPXTG cell wall anchor domain-containing protein [Loigolactobacillus binensis]